MAPADRRTVLPAWTRSTVEQCRHFDAMMKPPRASPRAPE